MQNTDVVEKAPPGPVSIFRRKVRKPVTLTLTCSTASH